jgi:ATP-dependent Lon protease
MPFDHISFGSIKDSTILVGHSSTYIGSTPGLFTKIQLNTKRLDTVVLLDEIDKIPDTQEGKSIYYVLLHMLDKLQNHRFRDMYMPEIDLDFSKMIFICAGNSVDNINPIVRDRMDIIEIKDYDIDEKTQIVMKYMLPKIISDLGFNKSDIILEENELKYLIKNKTINKTGMREIERKLSQLCERLSLLKYVKNINFSYNLENIVFPHKVTISDIDKLI